MFIFIPLFIAAGVTVVGVLMLLAQLVIRPLRSRGCALQAVFFILVGGGAMWLLQTFVYNFE